MIKVNLIGDCYSKTATRKRATFQFAMCLFFSAALCTAFALYLGRAVGSLKRESGEKDALSRHVQEMAKKLTVLEHEKKTQEPRIAALLSVEGQATVPAQMLRAIAESIPDGSWLVGMNYHDSLLELRGVAANEEEISRLVKTLASYPVFSDVSLVRAKQATEIGMTGREFVVQATLHNVTSAGQIEAEKSKQAVPTSISAGL